MELTFYVLAVALFCVVGGTQRVSQVTASVGDIRLTQAPGFKDSTSKVSIYYSNGHEPTDWGEICADTNIGMIESTISKTICQQYGRKDGQFVPLELGNKSKIWLYNVSCGEDKTKAPYHILRCQHDVSYNMQRSCSRVVGVNCSGEMIATKDGGYKGQVYLCPPEDFYTSNHSVSTGLVLLYLYDMWRTINLKTQSDNSDLLDSICQQLGFTRAKTNSGVTRNASQFSFDYCYDLSRTMPYPYATPPSWLTTDQVDCKGSSRACSGCCYSYPRENLRDTISDQDDLVITCTFDTSKKPQPSEGDPTVCTFKADNTPLRSQACSDVNGISLRIFEITVGVLGPFAILGLILSVCGTCCCCVLWYRRRRDPERQPIVNNAPPHDDAGN